MKVLLVMLTFFLSVAIAGCTPDLVVKDSSVDWELDSPNKRAYAKAEIANVGNKDAGNFMVYFNGEEDPVSTNHRPQVRHNVPGLAKGSSIVLEADFADLAHPDNQDLGNVKKICIFVDPKNMVNEKDENNNEKCIPVP